MNPKFRNFVDLLEPLYRQLMAAPPTRVDQLPRDMPTAGIYVFSEHHRHLYVGRTNRMRRRLQEHSRPSSTSDSAPFAFTLARKNTGRRRASYVPDGSRRHLERDPRFRAAFIKAKERVRGMDVRFVQEGDPTRQALLELYVAIALGTPYNNFDTH
jgi:hypothetical protein